MLQGNWSQFGALMTAGGRSSARDYQISHPVVERLVRDVEPVPGVLGVRMMGGGEGGSVLALVDTAIAPDVIERHCGRCPRGGYGVPDERSRLRGRLSHREQRSTSSFQVPDRKR